MDYAHMFSRTLLRKFIDLYRSHPCLWDRTLSTYKDKSLREGAHMKLVDLIREEMPDAGKIHVMKKIESIRACYRREKKKVTHSGSKPYKPRLWYYDLLKFLSEDDGKPTAAMDNIKIYSESNDEEESIEDDSNVIYNGHVNEEITPMIEFEETSHYNRLPSTDNDMYTRKRHCVEIDDEYDAIGVNVAAKLRSMPPNTRIVAEKLINDVLYQGQTNRLNTSSAIVTHDPIKQDLDFM